MNRSSIEAFLRESNHIEGIDREPTIDEIDAADVFLRLQRVRIEDMRALQAVIAPEKPLRDKPGMNVRVGNYRAPEGGPDIPKQLAAILRDSFDNDDPWGNHITFEHLHPFMDGNGRTGRLLWAWQMHRMGQDPLPPFGLAFLHRFYYQTLARALRPTSARGGPEVA